MSFYKMLKMAGFVLIVPVLTGLLCMATNVFTATIGWLVMFTIPGGIVLYQVLSEKLLKKDKSESPMLEWILIGASSYPLLVLLSFYTSYSAIDISLVAGGLVYCLLVLLSNMKSPLDMEFEETSPS